MFAFLRVDKVPPLLLMVFMMLTSTHVSAVPESKNEGAALVAAIDEAGQYAPMDAEAMKARMRAGMSMFVEQTRMRLEAMADPELARLLAQFSRAYYEALIEAGFSPDEAMKLVVAVGFPKDR
ncbi:MAG: hypothetical protein AAFY29_06770 [Pseudomonadota bacterium]